MQERSVRGAVALITGAGSGIGRACAELFATSNATVAVTDITQERADAVAEAIVRGGGEAVGWKLDVSDGTAIEDVIAAVATRFGRLDIVVNNAGIPATSTIEDEAFDQVWERAIAINVAAHQRIIRTALPHLKRSPAARIVNIASVEGLGASRGHLIYSTSKTAVVGLTRAMAVELGRFGITCNCVCPGPVETEMTNFISDEHKQIFAKRHTALGRYARPAEIADMVLSLCLPSATYVTGAIIPVDGGFMARNS